jgi:hypothetical protein
MTEAETSIYLNGVIHEFKNVAWHPPVGASVVIFNPEDSADVACVVMGVNVRVGYEGIDIQVFLEKLP